MFTTVSFFRVFRTGFTNFWRNIWLSAAATLVMVITLVILTILLLTFVVTNYSLHTIQERVDISVFLKTGLAQDQINIVKTDLENNPLVKSVTYTSQDQALASFRDSHSNDPLILESLNVLSENPLPATLQVKATNLDDYPQISDQLKADKYSSSIDKVNFDDNRGVIEQLNRILKFIITFGIALIAIFALIAVLVIFNTIALTIYNRREEVEIMRLVGATNWYIRGPFIIEALSYSFVATLITTALLAFVYSKFIPNINNYLGTGGGIFNQPYLQLPYLFVLMLVISALLSVFSTMLAIRKYLRI